MAGHTTQTELKQVRLDEARKNNVLPLENRRVSEASVFTGTVTWVQIDLGEDADDADHLITPEERLRVAMARQ